MAADNTELTCTEDLFKQPIPPAPPTYILPEPSNYIIDAHEGSNSSLDVVLFRRGVICV
jgi:hypothetical protein